MYHNYSTFENEQRIATGAIVHLTILHFNDVYEITPVSGGRLGGLARVATLCKQLRQSNPNTLVTFAGDLYNPSGMGTAVVDNERLDGKHAVAVMNKVGIDYMTFGDHEINTVNQQQFADRVAATKCKIVSSNIFDRHGHPFSFGETTVLENDVIAVTNAAGVKVQVGIFGITKPIRLPQIEFTYRNSEEAITAQVAALRDKVDILIALTHQPLATDRALVAQFPAVDLLLGGDDHHNLKVIDDDGQAPIYKADSNARRVYILDLFFNTETKKLQIEDRLCSITAQLPDDPETEAEVSYWVERAFETFRAQGWEPTEVVARAVVDLDGFESTIRQRPTAFTRLITASMMRAAPDTGLAIICSWAIRLDDCIPAGSDMTRYDILRTFSYSRSPIYIVDVVGSFLKEILDFGNNSIGSGSHLLTSDNVTRQANLWQINGTPLEAKRSYRLAVADDLLNDYLFYINEERAKGVTVIGKTIDIHQALIEHLQG